MPIIDCEIADQLARLCEPVLRFAKGERIFPFNAETWIQHVGADVDWSKGPLRGTTLLDGVVLPGKQPPSIGPDDLGRPDLTNFKPGLHDFFLDFGGWRDDILNVPTSGDVMWTGDAQYIQYMTSPLTWGVNKWV